MATVTAGAAYPLDFRLLDLTALLTGTVKVQNSTTLVVDYGDGDRDEFSGIGIGYNAFGEPISGTLTGYRSYVGDKLVAQVEGGSASVAQFMSYVKNGDTVGGVFLVLNGNDQVSGSAFADYLAGGAGADVLSGFGGDDTLIGNDGNDVLNGGGGVDTASYGAASSNFALGRTTVGWLVSDKTGVFGQDQLIDVELLQFSDKLVDLRKSDTGVNTMSASVLRTPTTHLLSTLVANGMAPRGDALPAILKDAASTTSVATLAYEFFTGKVPTQVGVDFLISATGGNANNLNSAYYAKFDTVNRYINFAVNLGRDGDGKASFAAGYGSLSLFDATKKAYAAIFGGTPTDAKVHGLIDGRVDYLAYYGGDGATGIGTKAAMVGFLLAAAATEDVGVMARSNDAWLTDLSDGSAPFAVDILDPAKGYYKAEFIFGG